MRNGNGPAWITVFRDVICILIGGGGIVWQEISNDVNPLLLGVYTTLLGIPITVNSLALLTSGGGQRPSSSPDTSSSEPSSGS